MRFKNLSYGIALCALAVLAGCGGGNENAQQGLGAPGFHSGLVTALPNGGAQVTFSGQNTPLNLSMIQAFTPDFNPGMFGGTLLLGGPGVGNTFGGGTNSYFGQSSCSYGVNGQGSTVQILATPTNTGVGNVAGTVTLTPGVLQAAFGGAIPQLLGLYVDLKFVGTTISQGQILFCTYRDGAGMCRGGRLGMKAGVDCTW